MEFILHTENLIDNISGLYLEESGDSSPMPPEGLVIQYLNEANARLRSIFGRYMEAFFQESPDNTLATGDAYIYKLAMSSRREAGKAQALTDLAHEYLVNAVLAKVFATPLPEKAKIHEAMAISASEEIRRSLHSKLPPA